MTSQPAGCGRGPPRSLAPAQAAAPRTQQGLAGCGRLEGDLGSLQSWCVGEGLCRRLLCGGLPVEIRCTAPACSTGKRYVASTALQHPARISLVSLHAVCTTTALYAASSEEAARCCQHTFLARCRPALPDKKSPFLRVLAQGGSSVGPAQDRVGGGGPGTGAAATPAQHAAGPQPSVVQPSSPPPVPHAYASAPGTSLRPHPQQGRVATQGAAGAEATALASAVTGSTPAGPQPSLATPSSLQQSGSSPTPFRPALSAAGPVQDASLRRAGPEAGAGVHAELGRGVGHSLTLDAGVEVGLLLARVEATLPPGETAEVRGRRGQGKQMVRDRWGFSFILKASG